MLACMSGLIARGLGEWVRDGGWAWADTVALHIATLRQGKRRPEQDSILRWSCRGESSCHVVECMALSQQTLLRPPAQPGRAASGSLAAHPLSGRAWPALRIPDAWRVLYWHLPTPRLRAVGGRADLLFPSVCHRSEEHTSELQSLMRISYAVFCLKKKNITDIN